MLSFYAFLVHIQNLYMAFAITNTYKCGSTRHTNIQTMLKPIHVDVYACGSHFHTNGPFSFDIQAIRFENGYVQSSNWIRISIFHLIVKVFACNCVCMRACMFECFLLKCSSFSIRFSCGQPNYASILNLDIDSTQTAHLIEF